MTERVTMPGFTPSDVTMNVKAKEYYVLDKVTRRVLRVHPFKGYRFDDALQHYVGIDEPEYDPDTEVLALSYQ